MRKATIQVVGASPLSWSRYLDTQKQEGEDSEVMETRIWRDRFWSDGKGQLFIPPMAIKNSLVDAAQYRGEKIGGKGNKTWTQKFAAGILAFEPMMLGVKADALEPEWLLVPGSPGKGKRGTGARVRKCFPRLLQWGGIVELMIVDDVITADVLMSHLDTAGKFVGFGRFRPANGGFYGRWSVGKIGYSQM